MRLTIEARCAGLFGCKVPHGKHQRRFHQKLTGKKGKKMRKELIKSMSSVKVNSIETLIWTVFLFFFD